jgi:sugar lactone lactonase YvrE
MERRHLILIGAIAAATTLAGCGGSNSPPLPAAQNAPEPQAFRDAGKRRTLFVADVDNNVLLYTANINQKNPPLLGEITQGVTRSVNVCFGGGTLYVVNSGGSGASVAEYHRGSSSPFATITYGLDTPDACTVDRDGNLYVDDGGAGNPLIQLYPAGRTSPGKTIDIPHSGRASTPGGLVINRRGALFVSMFTAESETATVFRINRGSSTAKNLNLQDLPDGGALGIDKAGNLYAGGHEGDMSIYAPENTTPSRTFDLDVNGFYTDMTVTSDGTIYWPNYDEGAMYEFAPGTSSPTNEFATAGSGIGAAVGTW